MIVLFPEPLGPANTTTSGFLSPSLTVPSPSGFADFYFRAVAVFHKNFSCFRIILGNWLFQNLFFPQFRRNRTSCILHYNSIIGDTIWHTRSPPQNIGTQYRPIYLMRLVYSFPHTLSRKNSLPARTGLSFSLAAVFIWTNRSSKPDALLFVFCINLILLQTAKTLFLMIVRPMPHGQPLTLKLLPALAVDL